MSRQCSEECPSSDAERDLEAHFLALEAQDPEGAQRAADELSRLLTIHRVSCPSCGEVRSARSSPETRRAVCMNVSCSKAGEVISYSAYLDAYDALLQEEFRAESGRLFADGTARRQAYKIARLLLAAEIPVDRTRTLLLCWGELCAAPPPAEWQIEHELEKAARSILEERGKMPIMDGLGRRDPKTGRHILEGLS